MSVQNQPEGVRKIIQGVAEGKTLKAILKENPKLVDSLDEYNSWIEKCATAQAIPHEDDAPVVHPIMQS